MFTIIFALYAIVAIIYILACLFIIYHILKYSLSHAVRIFTLLLFTLVSVILFIVNVSLFFSANWNGFIGNIFS